MDSHYRESCQCLCAFSCAASSGNGGFSYAEESFLKIFLALDYDIPQKCFLDLIKTDDRVRYNTYDSLSQSERKKNFNQAGASCKLIFWVK
jgi:hypothetical protein